MEVSQFDLHSNIEDTHWWFKGRREIIFDLLKQYVPIDQNKVIAEIGCGTGGNLKFLSKYYEVIGIDTSPHAVKYAKERVSGDILLGDFRDMLRDKWEKIHGIILADVLEHIEEDAQFLKDIVGNLQAGTILLITVPAHRFLWSQHDIVLGHKRRYSAKSLRLLWKDLAVEDLFFSSFNSVLFPFITLYRLLKCGTFRPTKSDLRLHSSWANHILYEIFSIDRVLLKLFSLPCGTSYLSVLKVGR